MIFKMNMISLATITRKECIRILRIWKQTLLPSVITLTLYFIVFGNLIGKRVGDMHGVEYMSFIVPGLILMAVVTNTYTNVSSTFFGAKFQKYIEELLVSPTPNYVIILGYSLGGMFRGLLVAILLFAISFLFSDLQIYNLLIIVSVIILTSVLFSLAGFLNGIFAKKFDDVSIVPTFILTPLTFLGGVFYSIDLLPPLWQTVSLLNPILYMINAFRYGFIGVTDVNISLAYFMILMFITVLFLANVYLLRKGVGLRE